MPKKPTIIKPISAGFKEVAKAMVKPTPKPQSQPPAKGPLAPRKKGK